MSATLRNVLLALVGSGLLSVGAATQFVMDRTGASREQAEVAVGESLGKHGRSADTFRTRYVSIYATNADLAAAADEFALGWCHAASLFPALADKYADCLVNQRKSLTEGRPVCNLVDTTVRGRLALGVRLNEYQFDKLVEQRTTPVVAMLHNPDSSDPTTDVQAALAAASRRICPDP